MDLLHFLTNTAQSFVLDTVKKTDPIKTTALCAGVFGAAMMFGDKLNNPVRNKIKRNKELIPVSDQTVDSDLELCIVLMDLLAMACEDNIKYFKELCQNVDKFCRYAVSINELLQDGSNRPYGRRISRKVRRLDDLADNVRESLSMFVRRSYYPIYRSGDYTGAPMDDSFRELVYDVHNSINATLQNIDAMCSVAYFKMDDKQDEAGLAALKRLEDQYAADSAHYSSKGHQSVYYPSLLK